MPATGRILIADSDGDTLGALPVVWDTYPNGQVMPVGIADVPIDTNGTAYEIVCFLGERMKILPLRPTYQVRKGDTVTANVSIGMIFDA